MGSGTTLREHLDRIAPNLERTTEQKGIDPAELPDLTPEEEQAAILQAREDKYYRERKRAYWESVSTEPEIKLSTTNELKHRLKAAKTPAGKTFVIDDHNRAIADLICRYFANDPTFENEKDLAGNNYSLQKGLSLTGNVGVGKTFLMAFFHFNQNQSYTMANCRKIEGLWIEQMSNKEKPMKNVIDYYAAAIEVPVNSNPFGHQAIGTCFDDLGTETSPSKSYGEEKNVLAEILMNRYESGLPFNYTHITTNLSPHDISIKYGTRVRDRFREMFNLIQFPNDSKSRR